jgi:hypothetical protein
MLINLIKTIELTDYRPDGTVAQRRGMNAFCAPDWWLNSQGDRYDVARNPAY